MKIIIKKMEKSDIPNIMKIESVSFGTYHWSEQSFENEINNPLGQYFCAFDVDTNTLVGYGGYWLIHDEAHITTIAVAPQLRGKKIGEAILQKFIDVGYELKAKWFTLEVRAGNIAAQALYEKYGFDSLGLRHKYYQDNGEDALIMWTKNIWDSEFKENYQQLKTKFNELDLVVA